MSQIYPSVKKSLEALNIPEYDILAKNMVSVNSWGDYYTKYMTEGIIKNGTYGIMAAYLNWYALYWTDMDQWWKSSETKPADNPFAGYVADRKWILNEV